MPPFCNLKSWVLFKLLTTLKPYQYRSRWLMFIQWFIQRFRVDSWYNWVRGGGSSNDIDKISLLNDSLSHWLGDSAIVWVTDWPTQSSVGLITHSGSRSVTEWVNPWLSERVAGWVTQWLTHSLTQSVTRSVCGRDREMLAIMSANEIGYYFSPNTKSCYRYRV